MIPPPAERPSQKNDKMKEREVIDLTQDSDPEDQVRPFHSTTFCGPLYLQSPEPSRAYEP